MKVTPTQAIHRVIQAFERIEMEHIRQAAPGHLKDLREQCEVHINLINALLEDTESSQ